MKNLQNSLFHRSSGASMCFDFKPALTCYRALLEVLAPQFFLMCYFTSLTVEFTLNTPWLHLLKNLKRSCFPLPEKSKTKNALFN